MGVEVTIDRGVAVVRPATPEIARALLEVAGPGGVETLTGGVTAFRVSEDTAARAGLVDGASRPAESAADGPQGSGGTDAPDRVPEPTRGSSRAEWAEFLDAQGIRYSDTDRRNDLVALWERR